MENVFSKNKDYKDVEVIVSLDAAFREEHERWRSGLLKDSAGEDAVGILRMKWVKVIFFLLDLDPAKRTLALELLKEEVGE